MPTDLIETIISNDDTIRNRSINCLLENKTKDELLKIANELEEFRKSTTNLYHKVRASLFLFVIYRFYLQENKEIKPYGRIPVEGVKATHYKDFEKYLHIYL